MSLIQENVNGQTIVVVDHLNLIGGKGILELVDEQSPKATYSDLMYQMLTDLVKKITEEQRSNKERRFTIRDAHGCYNF